MRTESILCSSNDHSLQKNSFDCQDCAKRRLLLLNIFKSLRLNLKLLDLFRFLYLSSFTFRIFRNRSTRLFLELIRASHILKSVAAMVDCPKYQLEKLFTLLKSTNVDSFMLKSCSKDALTLRRSYSFSILRKKLTFFHCYEFTEVKVKGYLGQMLRLMITDQVIIKVTSCLVGIKKSTSSASNC